MQKINLPIFVSIIVVVFLFPAAPKAHANILDDVVNGVKKIFTPEPKKEFTIDSKIELAPNGDMDKNGQIDAGDTIRFIYTINNNTQNEYTFTTLKSNINRKLIHYIHNVVGAISIIDDGNTISIPNYTIRAGQLSTISFDARVNYYIDRDVLVSTEADLLNKDRISITKSLKQEKKAIRITKDKVPSTIKHKINKKAE